VIRNKDEFHEDKRKKRLLVVSDIEFLYTCFVITARLKMLSTLQILSRYMTLLGKNAHINEPIVGPATAGSGSWEKRLFSEHSEKSVIRLFRARQLVPLIQGLVRFHPMLSFVENPKRTPL